MRAEILEAELRKKLKDISLPQICPRIYNRRSFILDEYPIYHPDTSEYIKYWTEIEKRFIEGFWGEDKKGEAGGWRWAPPQLYYYVNGYVIEDEDTKTNSTVLDRPKLRGIEWLFFYSWITTIGFSGFSNDTEYTCCRIIKKIEEGKDLTYKETKLLEIAGENVKKKDGTYKKYVEAREYLYKTFDKPLGKPLYDNEAKNLFVLTSRRTGKSYWASALISHYFKFYGKKYYDESYINLKQGPQIVVGGPNTAKTKDLLSKFAVNEEYLKNNLGAYGANDDFQPGYFFQNTSGTLAPNSSSPYRHEYKIQENGIWKKAGTGTKILNVSYESNPEASVGTGPILSVIEEVGLVDNLLAVHAANETTMIRATKFGSALYIGTGGNIEKVIESRMIFKDPDAYDFLGFPDLWEGSIKPIGMFIPSYYVDPTFTDENGNQNVEEAYLQELIEREKRKKSSTSSAIDGYMMARPLVPSEMFLSATANIFPTFESKERLNEIEKNDLFDLFASRGVLNYIDKERRIVKWEEDTKRLRLPINELDPKIYGGNINGVIVVYEHPSDILPDPKWRKSLYKIVYDPVKDDGYGTSLAAIIVYKGYAPWVTGVQNDIVAEYYGRYDKVEDLHEIAIKLALYYNGRILVENNIPDFIRYCKRIGKYHLLQPTPWEAISKAIKDPGRKYDVGVTMTKQLNVHCEQLIRQWLLEDWKPSSEENEKIIPNIYKIKSPRILRELIQYSRDQNFDAISALKLLVLWIYQEVDFVVEDPRQSTFHDTLLSDFIKEVAGKKLYQTNKNPYYSGN